MGVEMVLLTALVASLSTTSLLGKVGFTVWVWAIFFTFPGTYSTQPAVTTQTFGHKYGGFIYAFLFSGDIINNALTGFVSKLIKATWGWLGLFLIISAFGLVALTATLFYPYRPRPGPRPATTCCAHPVMAKLGLVEIQQEPGENVQDGMAMREMNGR